MSTNLNYKQVSNVRRRTWDTETYDTKAKARQAELDSANRGEGVEATGAAVVVGGGATGSKEEFKRADPRAAGPEGSKRAFLKARKAPVADIDARIGSTEMVSAEAAALSKTARDGVVQKGVGWYCKVCDCYLKDSHTYLDHINGRKHQKKLGYTMRVERSTKDQVLIKLQELTKRKSEERDALLQDDDLTNFDDLVKAKDAEEELRRQERRRVRLERKRRLQGGLRAESESAPKACDTNTRWDTEERTKSSGTSSIKDRDEVADEEVETEEVDPALAVMMGFSGFK